jgi:hypothetical protein
MIKAVELAVKWRELSDGLAADLRGLRESEKRCRQKRNFLLVVLPYQRKSA